MNWCLPVQLFSEEQELAVVCGFDNAVGEALMVDKGAALTLIALSNGRHAVLDETLVVCAMTVRAEWCIALKVGMKRQGARTTFRIVELSAGSLLKCEVALFPWSRLEAPPRFGSMRSGRR